ncbi:SDR family NAD(P)-dependent oxidoreductase [Brucella pseudogrignonensis]|uniref:SDR family NAD(P)-dependent oxidoreductase n=1 Tax=Brucella pseudogrignonensis TaxID=419475 RepID=UPI003ECF9714
MSVLQDQVVVVTGAARGIGQAIANVVARDGAHVIVADILADEGEAVAEAIRAAGGEATAMTLDITQPDQVADLVKRILNRFGRIDGLVNNAALDAPQGFAWEVDTEDWRRVIEVDLNGAWYCSRAVIPAMRAAKRGRIVFISSIAARQGSPHLSPAYSTAKAGLIGLTISLSAQLEADGILVNAVTPGPTGNTGSPYSEASKNAYLASHPLGFGGAQPIADAVAFLLGPASCWTSGAVFNISGGHFRGI